MTHSTISLHPKLQFELLDNLKITPGERQKEKTADMNKEKKVIFFILNRIKFHLRMQHIVEYKMEKQKEMLQSFENIFNNFVKRGKDLKGLSEENIVFKS